MPFEEPHFKQSGALPLFMGNYKPIVWFGINPSQITAWLTNLMPGIQMLWDHNYIYKLKVLIANSKHCFNGFSPDPGGLLYSLYTSALQPWFCTCYVQLVSWRLRVRCDFERDATGRIPPVDRALQELPSSEMPRVRMWGTLHGPPPGSAAPWHENWDLVFNRCIWLDATLQVKYFFEERINKSLKRWR